MIDLLDLAAEKLKSFSSLIIDTLTPFLSYTAKGEESSDDFDSEINLHSGIPRLDADDNQNRVAASEPQFQSSYFIPLFLFGLLMVLIFSGYIFEILAFSIDLYDFFAILLEEFGYYGIIPEAAWLIAIGFILLLAVGLIGAVVRLLRHPLARQVSWILLSTITVLSLPLAIWLSNISSSTIPLYILMPLIWGFTLGVGVISYLPPFMDYISALAFMFGIPAAQITMPNLINRIVEQYSVFTDVTIKPFLRGVTYENHEISMTIYIFMGLLFLIGLNKFLLILSKLQSRQKA